MSRQLTSDEVRLWHKIMNGGGPVMRPTVVQEIRRAYDVTHFCRIIDLHGYTVALAHSLVNEYLKEAKRLSVKKVTVVTGKSGQIRREFEEWMRLNPNVTNATPKNGGGAYLVTLR
jgi:DNA-nicking Smr family endonuclease